MTFWDYIKHTIANAGTGAGRANRAEYFSFFVLCVVAGFAPIFVGDAMVPMLGDVAGTVGLIVSWGAILSLFIPLISLTARRYHDIGWSGWLALINIWPLLILIAGDEVENRYGPPPADENEAYQGAKSRTFADSIRAGLNSISWLS